MPDTYGPEIRSQVMARVKAKDTKPEMLLRKALFAVGIRGWRCHRKNLPGNPDLAFGRARLAVFVDGGFWHGHPSKWWWGRSGPYWDKKIVRNMERDSQADAALHDAGWTVLRFWDFEIENELDTVVDRVTKALRASAHADRS